MINYNLFQQCVENFRKSYENRFKSARNYPDMRMFLRENHLSLNMGRQAGHSYYVQSKVSFEENAIGFYSKNLVFKVTMPDATKNFYSINRPPRGLSLDHVKTIYVDRGCFPDSDYNIIDKIIETGVLFQVDPKCIIVILG